MLCQDSHPVADYIALLSQDTLLSVEVLKAANSAAFAAPPTTSLRDTRHISSCATQSCRSGWVAIYQQPKG